MKRVFGFLRGVAAAFWRGLDLLRRIVVNLVLLALVLLVIGVVWRSAPDVPEGAALLLRPAGTLVEERALNDPLGLLRGGQGPAAQTSLPDLLEAIGAARADARIAALVIETDDLQQAGVSKLAELRAALLAFKASGKPLLVRGERYSQGQYYLASVADEIHLAPDGFVLLRGLARYVTYFKGALDKLGVKVHVFRVGEYKSFSEPFTRGDMSDADREATRDLLDALWDVLRADVAAARPAAAAHLANYIDDYAGALAAADGDPARAAVDASLVDRLSTRDQWRTLLMEKVGADDEGKDFRRVEVADYLAAVRAARPRERSRVAVLVAQGAIVDGSAGAGAVGGDSFARLIRQAREDERVKALVLRIDSPGGSAWASEVIRRELELTREAGKPVFASMSSVAASGGYWIAAGADQIWAAPTTLTGSIGIFAMFPELAAPLERLGLTVDGVATAPLAGAFDPRLPLEPAAAAALQQGIEHGYRRFLAVVAGARGMTPAEVDPIARGRVWTGEAAHKLGLVDELGGLDAVVAAVAARAGLERYEVVWPGSALSPAQRLLRRLGDVAATALPSAPGADSPLGMAFGTLQAEAQALLRWNDPQHMYAHCLCAAP
jgi:protease-4